MAIIDALHLLAASVLIGAAMISLAVLKGSIDMSAASDRFAASLAACTAAMSAVITEAKDAKAASGDDQLNAAADQLDALTASANAVLTPVPAAPTS